MSDWVNRIHQGDAVEVLDGLPESSVHMAMCSPPYFGLRDYGVDGQIGLEDSLEEYIAELVDVGRSLRRVLRDDGSWWLNLGDTYASDSAQYRVPDGWESRSANNKTKYPENPPSENSDLGRKNKMLVPHRTAIALQEAGWIVRNDVVWAKPNPMPESVTDRLSTTFEFVFHLTPQPDYWYDLDAIREPYNETTEDRYQYEPPKGEAHDDYADATPISGGDGTVSLHESGKNPGDVFEVTTKSFPEAHFAVYPPELCETPIKASCPPEVCVECGTPYERAVDREPGEYDYSDRGDKMGHAGRIQASGTMKKPPEAEFKGWEQVCDCEIDETEPGIVLDPFVGAGTTCLVAKRLGRRYIGIDLSEEYVAMARARLDEPVERPEHLEDTSFDPRYPADPHEW